MSGVVDKVSTDGQSLSPTPKTPLETELYEALENLQNQVHQLELEKAELLDQHSQEVECLVEKKASSLQRRVQEQAALLDVATDAIFVRDLDGNILYWNKGAETLYGWAAEAALENNASKLMYPDGANNDGEIYKNLLRQGSWKGERSQVTKSKQKITVMSRWTLVKDEADKPKFILTVNTDITEAKQLEAQFLRAQRLESVGTLASGIAHDLNNILTPVYGISQLLEKQLPDVDEPIKQQFKILQTSAKRGSEIIKQVLSFARGREGDRTPLAIKHLFTEIKSFIQKTFPKSLDISVNVPANLWAVNADATQLYQVLMNLLVNARDAMPNGGQMSLAATNLSLEKAIVIRQMDMPAGAYVLITVTDTGIGIAADKLDSIFEPFFSTKQSVGGTGLGLPTVYSIVKSHGGFIDVHSEIDKGTQFKIYLPAIEAAGNDPDEALLFPSGNGEWVLVVDDEEVICDVAKTILESHHYRVLVAKDGIDAIAQFAEYKADIDVVLMDMTVPALEAATVIEIVQKIKPDVKMVAISGLPGHEQVVASLKDIKAFLPKPYSSAMLLTTLQAVLSSPTELDLDR